ncbi:MAG: carbohydrate-binding family 9-like protein [Planctomycetota bacterium]
MSRLKTFGLILIPGAALLLSGCTSAKSETPAATPQKTHAAEPAKTAPVTSKTLTAEPAARGSAKVVTAARGPIIDGTFADPAWNRAVVLELGTATDKTPGNCKTTARLLFDNTHVYIGIDCAEPETDKLKMEEKNRDGDVFEDDDVEIFLSPDPAAGYKQFVVNALGTVMDRSVTPDLTGDVSWNAGVQVKTSIEKGKRWIATLAIPLADLGAKPGENLTWRANFARTRQVSAEDYSWSILPDAHFNNPDKFGTLTGIVIR